MSRRELPDLPHAKRLQRLREDMASGELTALVVSHPPNVRYLSGFTGSSGLLVVTGGGALLVTDRRYEAQAESEAAEGVDVRISRDGLLDELAEAPGTGERSGRLGFEAEHVSVQSRERMGEKLEADWTATTDLVEGLRARKDEGEMARLRRAAELTVSVLDPVLEAIEEGMTERELAAEVDYRLRRAGSGPPAFESIVASGDRSALPHARPSERKLREGDLVLLDFGATFQGYCADLTRIAVLGSATDWQREVHEAVEGARRAAVAAVRDGRPARGVDRAARERLEEAGWADAFGHSTGHGLGLEVHEDPSVSRRSDEILRRGNVVTIEPGVYLRGRGGIRLEDDVAVLEDGAEVLTESSRGIREL